MMSPVRLPAEWEPQSGVMLTWPHRDTDWSGNLDKAETVFVQISQAVTADESLLVVCRNPQHRDHVQKRLAAVRLRAERIAFGLADSNDSWARDHGPITVVDDHGRPLLQDFVFDGWGGKFGADKDTRINASLARQGCFGDCPLQPHDFVLEGGALETDGAGTLLATRSSVLDPKRNPGWTVERIQTLLRETLGLQRLLWLDQGSLSGDDTDAHIDVLARFVDPHTIVYSTAPEGDQDHPALSAMQTQLRSLRAPDGSPYRLRPLPFPGIHRDSNGRRLPASYANFLITNHAVLLPVYGVPADRQAESLLADSFPARRIVPIDCRALIQQNGSLHCLSMQFPRGVPILHATK